MVDEVRTNENNPSEKQPSQRSASTNDINRFANTPLHFLNATQAIKNALYKNLEQDLLDQRHTFEAIVNALDNGQLSHGELTLSLLTKIVAAQQFTLKYIEFRDIPTEKLHEIFKTISEKLSTTFEPNIDPFFIFYPVKNLMMQVVDVIRDALKAKKCSISMDNDVFFTYMFNLNQILGRGVDFYHFNPVYSRNAKSFR